MRKKGRKLTLHTETLLQLEALSLRDAAGGILTQADTCPSNCPTCHTACGSCAPCTRQPCPISDEGSCGC